MEIKQSVALHRLYVNTHIFILHFGNAIFFNCILVLCECEVFLCTSYCQHCAACLKFMMVINLTDQTSFLFYCQLVNVPVQVT